jgi:hypothetical protein
MTIKIRYLVFFGWLSVQAENLQSAAAQCALRMQVARHHRVLEVAEEQAQVRDAESTGTAERPRRSDSREGR